VPKGPAMHTGLREREYAYVHMFIASLFSCRSEQLPAEKPHVKNMDLEKCNSRAPINNGGNDRMKAFLMPDPS